MSDRKTRPTRPLKSGDVPAWDMVTDVAIVGFGGAGATPIASPSPEGGTRYEQ